MDGSIADIITQFASYLSQIFKYVKQFLDSFLKKKEEDAPAEEDAGE